LAEKRHLLIGAVALVKGRVRDDGKAMASICDEFEPHFKSENPLEGAPFDVVSLILRYGADGSKEPEVGRVNKRHSELEVAMELPMAEVRALGYDDLRALIRESTLNALIAVADKYDLPKGLWEGLRSA